MERPTREQVLVEPAGKRLDTWVAEMVMGIASRDVRVCGSTEVVTIHSNNPALSDGHWNVDDLRRHGSPHPYSTETEDAWAALLKWPGDFDLLRRNGIAWKCELFKPSHEWVIWADTAPLAICRALLIASLESHP